MQEVFKIHGKWWLDAWEAHSVGRGEEIEMAVSVSLLLVNHSDSASLIYPVLDGVIRYSETARRLRRIRQNRAALPGDDVTLVLEAVFDLFGGWHGEDGVSEPVSLPDWLATVSSRVHAATLFARLDAHVASLVQHGFYEKDRRFRCVREA